MKILVVEDDPTVGPYVKRGLEEHQNHVDLVDDGLEALRLASGGLYDLLVLDLRLPGMDGFEVTRRIKSDPQHAGTRIIAMTGYYEGEVAQRVVELGALLCLQKPFSPDDLRRALAKAGVEIH